MARMTDPSDALTSFQKALLDGELQLRRGEIDPELFVHHDNPQGKMRLTYACLEGQTVTALAIVVMGDPIEGLPCFELGVAVPEAYRSQGRAKKTVEAAIAELKHGLARNKISTFYVPAQNHLRRHARVRRARPPISSGFTAGSIGGIMGRSHRRCRYPTSAGFVRRSNPGTAKRVGAVTHWLGRTVYFS